MGKQEAAKLAVEQVARYVFDSIDTETRNSLLNVFQHNGGVFSSVWYSLLHNKGVTDSQHLFGVCQGLLALLNEWKNKLVPAPAQASDGEGAKGTSTQEAWLESVAASARYVFNRTSNETRDSLLNDQRTLGFSRAWYDHVRNNGVVGDPMYLIAVYNALLLLLEEWKNKSSPPTAKESEDEAAKRVAWNVFNELDEYTRSFMWDEYRKVGVSYAWDALLVSRGVRGSNTFTQQVATYLRDLLANWYVNCSAEVVALPDNPPAELFEKADVRGVFNFLTSDERRSLLATYANFGFSGWWTTLLSERGLRGDEQHLSGARTYLLELLHEWSERNEEKEKQRDEVYKEFESLPDKEREELLSTHGRAGVLDYLLSLRRSAEKGSKKNEGERRVEKDFKSGVYKQFEALSVTERKELLSAHSVAGFTAHWDGVLTNAGVQCNDPSARAEARDYLLSLLRAWERDSKKEEKEQPVEVADAKRVFDGLSSVSRNILLSEFNQNGFTAPWDTALYISEVHGSDLHMRGVKGHLLDLLRKWEVEGTAPKPPSGPVVEEEGYLSAEAANELRECNKEGLRIFSQLDNHTRCMLYTNIEPARGGVWTNILESNGILVQEERRKHVHGSIMERLHTWAAEHEGLPRLMCLANTGSIDVRADREEASRLMRSIRDRRLYRMWCTYLHNGISGEWDSIPEEFNVRGDEARCRRVLEHLAEAITEWVHSQRK